MTQAETNASVASAGTSGSKTRADKAPLSWTAQTLILTNVVLMVLAAWAFLRFGSLSPALGYLRGERLIVDEPAKSLGVMDQGRGYHATFNFTNLSGEPITILGAKASCACTVAEDLPTTIPGGGKHPLKVAYRSDPKKAGDVAETLRVYTDHPEQPEVILKVTGRVPVHRDPGGPASESGAGEGPKPKTTP